MDDATRELLRTDEAKRELLRRGPLHNRPLSYTEKVGLWTSRNGKVYIPQPQLPLYFVLSTLASWGLITDKVEQYEEAREERDRLRTIAAEEAERKRRSLAAAEAQHQKRLREAEARCRV